MTQKTSFSAEEIGPALQRRMGSAAPAATGADEVPPRTFVSPPTGGPGASQDYSLFGEKTKAIDEGAKTPAVKAFPKQGEALHRDGEYNVYRGFGGVPFRSKSEVAPDIKASDPRQPVVTADAAARIFDLSVPEDLLAYTEVWDRATKGYYVAPVEERQWVPEKQTWKIFMRWGVKYWELPDE